MKSPIRLPFLIAACACLLAGLASPAHAAPKASLKFNGHRVSQGAKVKVSWKVSGKPKGGSVLLQRTVGTAAKYTTVQTLKAGSGTVTVKAPSRGKYRYRVLVRDRAKRTRATATQTLYSYADVKMAQLTGGDSHTVQIGGALFRYVRAYGYNRPYRALLLDSTSCRGGTLSIAKSGDLGGTGTVEIVQEFADPQEFTLESGDIEEYAFSLASRGAMQINMSDGDSDEGALYLNGVFSCYTSTGQS